jgi:Cdc6-like AAA superfamily ATPase
MITAPRVFEAGHQPRQLLHRESAVGTVLRRLRPTAQRGCGDVLLAGPSGVGKTVLATHCCQRLQGQRGIDTAHVQTLGTSPAGIVRDVLQQLPGPDPATNTPAADLNTMLYDRVDEPTVVVLDEGDDLPGSDALQRLFDVAAIGVVVICHDPDAWLASADRRVRDRLGSTTLGLDRYTVDELADILEARARVGLEPGSVTRRQLEAIADQVAGVARAGIQTLRAAAQESARRGYGQVRGEVLERAHEIAQYHIREQRLQSLPFHHQVLYELVRQSGGLQAGALHERYDAVAEEVYQGLPQTPIGERERRRKCRKLVEYGLIKGAGENRDREYRVCDEGVQATVRISLGSAKTSETDPKR